MISADPMDGLLGRLDDLAHARAAIDAIEAGVPRALEVRGEPGIGKSTLLKAMSALAERAGHFVLSGRAGPLERDLPYGVFVDALDEHLRGLAPRQLERLGHPLVSELAHLFPSLAAHAGAARASLDERYRSHRAVRDLLERIATARPFVLLLDDVHWADPASIELLSALLRRPPQAGVLLTIALRSHPLDQRLATALAYAQEAGAIDRLELGPLAAQEAELLLQGRVARTMIPGLYAQAGGNPFYLEQFARTGALNDELGSQAQAAATLDGRMHGETVGVPPAIVASLTQELGHLSHAARRLVNAAAVAGDPFEDELAAAAAGSGLDEALEAVDELVSCEIVRPTGEPRRFCFRHPLVRWAVYHGAPAGWRISAHARVANALTASGASLGARANHVAASARKGDVEAIALLSRAGEVAVSSAPATAARWFAAALRLLPDHGPDVGRRRELLAALAPALAAVGRLGESRRAILALLELVPSPDERVGLIVDCAELELLLGQHRAAQGRLLTALEDCAGEDSPEAVVLMLALGQAAFVAPDFCAMIDWSRRALEKALRLGDPPLIAAAAGSLGLAAANYGDLATADRARAQAASIVDDLSDAELAPRIEAVLYLGWAEGMLERYDDSLRHSERGIALARTIHDSRHLPGLKQVRVVSHMMRDPIRAKQLQEEATEAARLSSNPGALCWALMTEGWIAYLIGDTAEAMRRAEECVRASAGIDDSEVTMLGAVLVGTLRLEAGAAAPSSEHLLALCRSIDSCWNISSEALTRAELRRGRLEAARNAARHAEHVAAQAGLRMPSCWARRARASVLLAEGAATAAYDEAIASAEDAESVGALVDGARSRVLAARALAREGKRTRAAEELRAAAQTFDRFDVTYLRDEAASDLRRLGQRFRQRPRDGGSGVASLTPRELEVAKLVARGQTNRQIAVALCVTEKTVESHLRSIFGKLGICSRAAVARELDGQAQR